MVEECKVCHTSAKCSQENCKVQECWMWVGVIEERWQLKVQECWMWVGVIEERWQLKVHLWEIMTIRFYGLWELFGDLAIFGEPLGILWSFRIYVGISKNWFMRSNQVVEGLERKHHSWWNSSQIV
jgi:hypothetical protein